MARWIPGRRKDALVDEALAESHRAFGRTLGYVESAKAALADAAPGHRSRGVPLAGALLRFDEGLSEATASMDAWRHPLVDREWTACRSALTESGRLAEHLRMGEAPAGYEALYGALGDVMAPLDGAFDAAVERFQVLGL
jgi:hypothetical protein